MKFSHQYFIAAIILFAAEAFIAAFMHDDFIRPIFGDYLVVILVYCALKAAFKISYKQATIIAVLFAYLVETLQYFHFISLLGLDGSLAAHLILGAGFSWADMVAYTLGGASILLIEYARLSVNKDLKTICQDL